VAEFANGEVRVLASKRGEADATTFEGRSVDGRWRCYGRLAVDSAGRLLISHLEIQPWVFGDDCDLSTDTMRKFPLGRWKSEVHAILSDESKWLSTGEVASTVEGRAWARTQAENAKELTLDRGPKGYPDDHYRRIALAYLDLQSQGVSRGIVRRIAEDEGRQWQTIRDWLHRATELGFLSRGAQGRAGRTPGPNLYKEAGQ
jgi:hypothetical protein